MERPDRRGRRDYKALRVSRAKSDRRARPVQPEQLVQPELKDQLEQLVLRVRKDCRVSPARMEQTEPTAQ